MGHPILTSIDDSTGSAYRTKTGDDALRKHVLLIREPADYKVPWGDQSFDRPHMAVQCDMPYGIHLDEFESTHIQVGEDLYVKSAKIRALQLTEETEIITMVSGEEESRSLVPAGEWIVRNPGGEVYPVPDEEFRSKYDLDQ